MAKAVYRRRARHILMQRNNGFSLIEAMLAVAACAFVASTLSQTLADFMRFSTNTERHVLAGHMAQEVLDCVRGMPWSNTPVNGNTVVGLSNLASAGGTTYNLMINGSNGTGPSVDPRPLALDETNLIWTGAGSNGNYLTDGNKFTGTATLTLTLVDSEDIAAKCTISWSAAGGPRTVSAITTVSQYGIHNQN